jgi:hypothetical protein
MQSNAKQSQAKLRQDKTRQDKGKHGFPGFIHALQEACTHTNRSGHFFITHCIPGESAKGILWSFILPRTRTHLRKQAQSCT